MFEMNGNEVKFCGNYEKCVGLLNEMKICLLHVEYMFAYNLINCAQPKLYVSRLMLVFLLGGRCC